MRNDGKVLRATVLQLIFLLFIWIVIKKIVTFAPIYLSMLI